MIRELLQKLLGSPWTDRACLYGRFGMTVYDMKDGQQKVVRRIQKKNQVVNDGARAMLELLCQMDVGSLSTEQNQIWSLSVGTVGTPPAVTDTLLLGQVWAEQFALAECAIAACPPYEIQIYKTLPTTPCSANGSILREAGVFTRGTLDDPYTSANRRLYCRQTHPPIEKVNTMQIVYDWRLGITVEGA
jgi:hypothetical protein